MIRFEYQHSDSPVKVVVELDEDSTLAQALDAVQQFLIAAGYDAQSVRFEMGER